MIQAITIDLPIVDFDKQKNLKYYILEKKLGIEVGNYILFRSYSIGDDQSKQYLAQHRLAQVLSATTSDKLKDGYVLVDLVNINGAD